MLREFEGLSYHEIGERVGLTRPSVECTLFRARRRLARGVRRRPDRPSLRRRPRGARPGGRRHRRCPRAPPRPASPRLVLVLPQRRAPRRPRERRPCPRASARRAAALLRRRRPEIVFSDPPPRAASRRSVVARPGRGEHRREPRRLRGVPEKPLTSRSAPQSAVPAHAAQDASRPRPPRRADPGGAALRRPRRRRRPDPPACRRAPEPAPAPRPGRRPRPGLVPSRGTASRPTVDPAPRASDRRLGASRPRRTPSPAPTGAAPSAPSAPSRRCRRPGRERGRRPADANRHEGQQHRHGAGGRASPRRTTRRRRPRTRSTAARLTGLGAWRSLVARTVRVGEVPSSISAP